MTRRIFALVTAGTAATALSLATVSGPAGASPEVERNTTVPTSQSKAKTGGHQENHNRPDPLYTKQQTLRQATVDKYIKGKAETKTINGTRVLVAEDGSQTSEQRSADGGRTHKKPKKRYVQYEPTEKSNVFTVLSEFGTKTREAEGGTPGPLHNKIPEPDRKIDGTASDDNSTYWKKDFNRDHYMNLMFSDSGESMRDFYLKQSLGRHYLQGDVSNWVQVPYNEARYGSNNPETSTGEREWAFVGDSLTAWYNAQKKAGKSNAQIKKYLEQFDVWDRYDHDGDGDFNESDGYIDHFQAIHAGMGEEAGGGAQGTDAIWSHRWSVQAGTGQTGPDNFKAGGVQIGDTGIWVRDYTTEPENGGLGVFAHEYAHDLGLPDLYDTSENEVRGNGVQYWSLMSSGSWLGHGKGTTGTTPNYMGAWEKVQLGWADVQTLENGHSDTIKLGPADQDNSRKPQAIAVNLPDKTVVTDYNKPKSGEFEWWSGRGDSMNSTLTQDLDLTGKKSASVSAAVWYDIEADYDYLYGQVSTDGGKTWTNVGEPLTGKKAEWGEVSYDLSAYAGKKVQFRFLYQTDEAVNEAGAFLDDIVVTIDGTSITDDVESEESDWTADGFTRMGGSTSKQATHYYLAEYRRYSGYDTTLKTGPYNFGWAPQRENLVEHFPYQDGLLIWYVDNEFENNNVSDHPGHGQVLPVDAHAAPMRWPDGTLSSLKIQTHDSTFGLTPTDKFTLHKQGLAAKVSSKPAVREFDDTNPNRYWYEANPLASTKVAGSGTKIKVVSKSGDGLKVKVTYKDLSSMRKK